MVVYRIRVPTGTSLCAGSNNQVQLWLVGQHGEAAVGTRLRPTRGKEEELKAVVLGYLGPLLFVKLRKRRLLQDDARFCNWSSVQEPGDSGDEFRFPCYRWVEGDGVLSLPEGTGRTVVDDPQGLFKKHREEELEKRGKLYRWGNWKEGLILNVAGNKLCDLPADERFLEDKRIDFETSPAKGLADLAVKASLNVPTCWEDLDDFSQIFWSGQSKLAEWVRDSWKEDALFGYQFLHGTNPMLLSAPSSSGHLVFPPGMEELQVQLEKELQGGTLFEADFSLLDAIANVILCSQQHLAAPLVMLKLQPDGKLLSTVIHLQLPRVGSPAPPLFLPTDPPMVWLLAKCWVRSSDFQLYELQSHLLRGHLTAEVFAVATMRCLPSIHCIFELIILHLDTPYIRVRTGLVSDLGVFDQVVSTGGGGHVELLKRAGAFLTYSSFCPLDDLADRGLLEVKSCYYAQEALWLWEIISRYVEGIVNLHYKTDVAVKDDLELQTWCQEITEIGPQGAQDRGFPVSFSLQSRDQLCHFVTMCIFTCTGQHSSIHLGQLDWYTWVPNAPCTIWLPPPTTKDAMLEMVMATLPSFHQVSLQMSITWQLGRYQPIMVALGQHKEEYFSGPGPKAVLKKFREELVVLDKETEIRNAKLDMPYEYLRPSLVENSVAI
ncbi:LOW QUALITY PROTEIN: polyunsaturated fatty acid lipoxygenase ALOX15-like [Dugong dugon]